VSPIVKNQLFFFNLFFNLFSKILQIIFWLMPKNEKLRILGLNREFVKANRRKIGY
jgi:hypothetical protein